MTDQSLLLADTPPLPPQDLLRARAFRAANRHSLRVRRLRRALIIGAVALIVGIVAVTVLDPFGKTVEGVAIDGTSIDGTKVTMINPKLSGYQKDGRPYAIEASRAVQDIKSPTLFELHDLKARLIMTDKTETRLTATIGTYNSAAETMHLDQGAHVVGDNGLDATTDAAMVEFKTNTLSTTKPVTVVMPGRRIAADRMTILDGGKQVTFDGHVHTDIVPGPQGDRADKVSAAPAPEQASPAPQAPAP